MSERRITDGGRQLRAYLTEHKVSVPDFCTQHGLDRIQVQRVLNGERWKRVTVDFAHSIEQATSGRVSYTQFLPETATSADDSAPELDADDSGEHPAAADIATHRTG
jgi:hypothetical protein